MYLFVHVIIILLAQYPRMAAMGLFVMLALLDEVRDGGAGMASKRFGERRDAESSMSSVKSRFLSSEEDMVSCG